MGERGLEGRGRRPQRKGCLLLAVAGVTSLVTLLLAVPITVVAVLALVPQEQGGLVTGTADPGIQAPAHQRFESGELPEEDSETDLSPRLPAAHLIGKDPISLIRIPSHWRLDHGAGARLGGEERRGVSEERDAVLGRRRAGPPAGRPLLPLLSRRLPGPGAPSRRGPPGPLGHAAQPAVPGGGRLWIGDPRAAAGGRGDRDTCLGPRQEARIWAPLVHERGVRWPGAAPEGREGVRQYQSPRHGGLQEGKDLLRGGDGGVKATCIPKSNYCLMRVCE
ncbi:lymphotoxin-beta isoform 1-T1 [Dama dama]